MKRLIYITILVLTFCFVNFGQETTCEMQPTQYDEYLNYSNGSQKHIMQGFIIALQELPKCIGVIRLQSAKNEEILRQYNKLQKSFLFLRLPFEKITLMIIPKSKEEKVEFWLTLPNVELPNCEECLIIRAKDFPKIQELFKPTTKKRKN